MSSFEKSEYVHGVFTKIAPSYDLMNDIESLGLHRVWKDRLVKELSRPNPKRILDIACGTGDIAIALAKENREAAVIGLDFCEEMLEVARERAAKELPISFKVEVSPGSAEHHPAQDPARHTEHDTPLYPENNPHCHSERSEESLPLPTSAQKPQTTVVNNLRFMQGNAMELPFADNTYDAVSISFGLRNMPDYEVVLAEIHRVLKPGGQFRCLEASYPTNPVVKPPFKLYFKHWLPVLGKLIVNSPDEYAWLNTSTEAFLSKDELKELMEKVGFASVSYTSFLFGAAALHRGTV